MRALVQTGIWTCRIGVDLPGALYYVSSSSRQRGAFLDDIDCAEFLGLLSANFTERGWRCYGYCLVPDGYHLLVETNLADLSRGLRDIQDGYAGLFRRRHHVVRPNFWDSYRLFFVDKHDFLLPVHRHIIRMPLEMRMVTNILQWRWSSYWAMIGRISPDKWLETWEILERFTRLRAMARRRYRSFIQEPTDRRVVRDARHGIFLGDEAFVRKTLAALWRSTPLELSGPSETTRR